MDYILFNVDNGDVLHLGRVMPAYPNESLGLAEEHLIFQYVPDVYRANELQEMKDAYLNRVHALSFFLQISRHCKLTVIPIHEFDEYSEIAMKQLKDEGRIAEKYELYHGPMLRGNHRKYAETMEQRMLESNGSNKQIFTGSKIRDADFSAEIIESIKLSILSSPKEGSRIEYSAIGRTTRPSLRSRAL